MPCYVFCCRAQCREFVGFLRPGPRELAVLPGQAGREGGLEFGRFLLCGRRRLDTLWGSAVHWRQRIGRLPYRVFCCRPQGRGLDGFLRPGPRELAVLLGQAGREGWLEFGRFLLCGRRRLDTLWGSAVHWRQRIGRLPYRVFCCRPQGRGLDGCLRPGPRELAVLLGQAGREGRLEFGRFLLCGRRRLDRLRRKTMHCWQRS
mmetsp:Transcript_103037/g.332058  ORF Transcript_103037/g.332058 Transcript_103037/m.332058 type:complete len:203 (-) Transcript_103037:357-965(-)